jgi:hypothetical protein
MYSVQNVNSYVHEEKYKYEHLIYCYMKVVILQ